KTQRIPPFSAVARAVLREDCGLLACSVSSARACFEKLTRTRKKVRWRKEPPVVKDLTVILASVLMSATGFVAAGCGASSANGDGFGGDGSAGDGGACSTGCSTASCSSSCGTTPPPPEHEDESHYTAPVSTGNYVWVANPDSGRVAYIDASTYEVKLVDA